MINLTINKSKKEKILGSKTFKSKMGFTLFVAMIVTSLLLAVGFSISNIILKQILLAGSGKESQIAFYAADSGAECAQFWDTKNYDGTGLVDDGPFATSTPVPNIVGSPASTDIWCGGGVALVSKEKDDVNATSTLIIDYTTTNYRACSRVQIIKGFTTLTSGDQIPFTKIVSRGYNSSVVSGACDTSNQRTVERGLLVNY